jgi:OmpA-OmpF porin, OOP family
MKHLNRLVAGAMLFAGLSATAQDSTNKWAISFGANAVDTKISAASPVKEQINEFYNVSDHWNIVPSVSYINVSRNIGSSFNFGLTGSFNKISRWLNKVPGTENTFSIDNPGDLNYYAVDANIGYSFMKLLGSKWFDPSLNVGGGYNFFGDASAGTVNGGVGLDLWFAKNVALTLASTYKQSIDDTRLPNVDVPSHMFHQAGLKFKFGASDRDDDGIIDSEDTCPDEKGLPQFQGCPDTDGDGIENSKDSCPDEIGTPEMNGCPDADGDGIADKDDECQNVPGVQALNGCPDNDGDGVADSKDKCPTVKGPRENAGCPWPDTDGDGVLDKDDKCVTVKGTVANNGCPEVSEDVVKKLNDYAKVILFDTSKSTFQQQTYPILEAMVGILKEYPSSRFALEGHTDSDGKDAANLQLSKDRAAAVKNYLVEKGIAADRLTSEGFGEAKPIVPNTSKANKAQNRRVEVKLLK